MHKRCTFFTRFLHKGCTWCVGADSVGSKPVGGSHGYFVPVLQCLTEHDVQHNVFINVQELTTQKPSNPDTRVPRVIKQVLSTTEREVRPRD